MHMHTLLYTTAYNAYYTVVISDRLVHVPIMLLKLHVMLWSNVPEFSLLAMLKLCSICKPVFSTNSIFPSVSYST